MVHEHRTNEDSNNRDDEFPVGCLEEPFPSPVTGDDEDLVVLSFVTQDSVTQGFNIPVIT